MRACHNHPKWEKNPLTIYTVRFVEESGLGTTKQPSEQTITGQEILGNAFVLMLAGHETTANSIQHALIFLATNPAAQKHLQKDIDEIIGSKAVNDWDYKADCDRLFNSMVGAVIYEQLRLMPALMVVPKCVRREDDDQHLNVDGRDIAVPAGTFIHLNAYAVHRSPRYWPHGPSTRTSAKTDLSDFVPERWLQESSTEDNTTPKTLYEPPRGAFIPFSDGQRGCIGRRFALVELTAVIAYIFREYSVELAVDQWATTKQVDGMNAAERKAVYGVAVERAWKNLETGCDSLLTLRLGAGYTVPVRIVKRGSERFF